MSAPKEWEYQVLSALLGDRTWAWHESYAEEKKPEGKRIMHCNAGRLLDGKGSKDLLRRMSRRRSSGDHRRIYAIEGRSKDYARNAEEGPGGKDSDVTGMSAEQEERMDIRREMRKE